MAWTITPSRLRGRRRALRLLGLGLPVTVAAHSLPALAAAPRVLSFRHTHTKESLDGVTYWRAGRYDRVALDELNWFLRDFRTGEVHEIAPELMDFLHEVGVAVGRRAPFHVISGYRSPATNAALQAVSGGVATRSLHMEGRAIDVRLPGVATSALRDAAIALGRGGVGYYPRSDFVHLDTGRPRSW